VLENPCAHLLKFKYPLTVNQIKSIIAQRYKLSNDSQSSWRAGLMDFDVHCQAMHSCLTTLKLKFLLAIYIALVSSLHTRYLPSTHPVTLTATMTMLA